MYPSGYSMNRHQELLAQSRRDGRMAQARAMRKASRQVERAARKLERAQATVRRLHGQTSQVY
jgi:hypothetical protein